jgi:hypothetical protein
MQKLSNARVPDLLLASQLLERLFPNDAYALVLHVPGRPTPQVQMQMHGDHDSVVKALRAAITQLDPRNDQPEATGTVHPVAWVKLTRYVELTGDSAAAVHARRRSGKWLDGNQCRVVDGTLWINLAEAQKWVTTWSVTSASSKGAAS